MCEPEERERIGSGIAPSRGWVLHRICLCSSRKHTCIPGAVPDLPIVPLMGPCQKVKNAMGTAVPGADWRRCFHPRYVSQPVLGCMSRAAITFPCSCVSEGWAALLNSQQKGLRQGIVALLEPLQMSRGRGEEGRHECNSISFPSSSSSSVNLSRGGETSSNICGAICLPVCTLGIVLAG